MCGEGGLGGGGGVLCVPPGSFSPHPRLLSKAPPQTAAAPWSWRSSRPTTSTPWSRCAGADPPGSSSLGGGACWLLPLYHRGKCCLLLPRGLLSSSDRNIQLLTHVQVPASRRARGIMNPYGSTFGHFSEDIATPRRSCHGSTARSPSPRNCHAPLPSCPGTISPQRRDIIAFDMQTRGELHRPMPSHDRECVLMF